MDRRVQTMEVSGQDILTRDKVSLRVNLTALWQVEDVVLKDVVRIQVPVN